jgi:hypothetical protein
MPFRIRVFSPLRTVCFLSILAVALGFEQGQAQSVKKSGSPGEISIADGSSINSAPLYVALKNGYFRQEGLEVTCRLFPSGKAALDAVREGKGNLGGKKIGVTPKTVSEYFLDVFLVFNRMPLDQINLIPLFPELKKQVNELCALTCQPARYKLDFDMVP